MRSSPVALYVIVKGIGAILLSISDEFPRPPLAETHRVDPLIGL